MPGSKRRIDEDSWLDKQLKKLKFAPTDANVYASTLAKLRQGARQVFSREPAPVDQATTSIPASISHQAAPAMDTATTPGSTTSNDTSVEGMATDILTDKEEMDTSPCEDCTRKMNQPMARNVTPGTGTDSQDELRCSYCENITCHLNYCKVCASGFCTDCCIPRYDEPTQDTFLCISCLNSH